MTTTLVDHPLAAVRLTTLRDASSSPGAFRAALHDLSGFLVYEATRRIAVEAVGVTTPLDRARGTRLVRQPIVVPVLRAGLGMLDAALELFPDAPVGFVGLKRDEQTLLPSTYVATVPADLAGQPALVLDPMLATGGSLLRTVELLLESGVGPVTVACVLAAPEGVAAVESSPVDVALFVASIDEGLDANGFIHPGLGDAGDREYGVA